MHVSIVSDPYNRDVAASSSTHTHAIVKVQNCGMYFSRICLKKDILILQNFMCVMCVLFMRPFIVYLVRNQNHLSILWHNRNNGTLAAIAVRSAALWRVSQIFKHGLGTVNVKFACVMEPYLLSDFYYQQQQILYHHLMHDDIEHILNGISKPKTTVFAYVVWWMYTDLISEPYYYSTYINELLYVYDISVL